jgi:hypothetical protein
VILAGLIAHIRYLLKHAFRTADAGHPAAAAMFLRSITESVLTLHWLKIDLTLGHLVWLLDGVRSTLIQHDEVRRNEKSHRRRQRRKGVHVTGSPLPPGLLERGNLLFYKQQQTMLSAQIKSLPGFQRRAKRLQVSNNLRLPSLQKRAQAARVEHVYSLGYRFDSQSAAHPARLAIELYLEQSVEGVRLRATPRGET